MQESQSPQQLVALPVTEGEWTASERPVSIEVAPATTDAEATVHEYVLISGLVGEHPMPVCMLDLSMYPITKGDLNVVLAAPALLRALERATAQLMGNAQSMTQIEPYLSLIRQVKGLQPGSDQVLDGAIDHKLAAVRASNGWAGL